MIEYVEAFCLAAAAVKKTGKGLSHLVDTYKNLRSLLIDKDKTLEPIVEDIENEPEDPHVKGYLEKKLQASPAMESPEIQNLLEQLVKVVEESKPSSSNKQSAKNIQGKVIQIQAGDNTTFHDIS